MAFGVSKWPLPCDPRDPCFCISGYSFDGTPAFQYRASSVGALAPFTALLPPGILIPFFTHGSFDACVFQVTLAGVTYTMTTTPIGVPPFAPAPAATLDWRFTASATPGGEIQIGNIDKRLPAPVSAPPPIPTLPVPPGPNLLPNPVLLEPAAWDAV